MDRREFIKTSFSGLAGIAVLQACVYEKTSFKFFSENEAGCIIALTDQIIPEDENGPGAVYANVVNYIDNQLINVFTDLQPLYKYGIKALQKTCIKLYGKKFENLEFDAQKKVLEKIEKNEISEKWWGSMEQTEFFNTVIDHTMQGFYGSPRHGGNKNYISYRLMDLEYPLIIGQNRYRSFNAK
jgi:gluconate 2-dehydrogenase gamma chain